MNRDNDFTLNDEEEDEDEVEAWDGEGEGVTETETEDNDGDVKDESTAYLEFLNDQVSPLCKHHMQALSLTYRRRRSLTQPMQKMMMS